MKRIISFLILFALFLVILTLPASEAPVVQHDPLPVWSILCYLMTVAAAGTVGFAARIEEEPVLA